MRFAIELRDGYVHAALWERETAEEMREFLLAVHAACGKHACPKVIMLVRRSRPAFKAAVFIGGMEGIHAEADMFAACWPDGKLIPVGTTGAAACELASQERFPSIFRTERTYPTLFRRQLLES